MMVSRTTADVGYTEFHSALRWPIVVNGILWVTLAVLFIVLGTATGNLAFLLLLVPCLIGVMATTGPIALIVNWPTGIRLDGEGVSIGGISRAEPHRPGGIGDRAEPPWAHQQRKQVFSCSWRGVQRAEVVTDPAELRKLASERNVGLRAARKISLGAMWAPHMKAALVLNIDLSVASVPQFRPPDTRQHWFRPSYLTPSVPSSIWFAPTRRPDALRAALGRLNVPGPTDPSSRLP